MIRKTLDTDIPAVMAIYDAARAFMRAHGNATQWPEGTPSAEQLAADIAAGGSYVCEVDGHVVATFAFLPGPDECYDVLRRSVAQRHSVRRAAPCGIRRHRARYRGCDVRLCQRACRSPAHRHASGQSAHAACEHQGGIRACRHYPCVGRHAACCVRLAARGISAQAHTNTPSK